MKRPEPDDITDVVAKGEPLRETRSDLRKKNADCALVVTPHPVTLQGQRVLDAAAAALMPGETLASFLARHGVVPGRQWAVSLGGVDVPEAQWGRVRPRHGHLIEARRVPQKDVLRVVAIAIIAYYTFGAGGMGGGSFMGLTGVAGYAAAAVAFYAGATMVGRLLGPKPQNFNPSFGNSNPTYSLTGGRNRMRQFEPMALVLGQPYCVPDLAAFPYTYMANGEQSLWQVLHAGINCASVESLRIGQTPVENYQNVMLSYEGFASGNTGLALLSNVDTIAGAVLDAPTSPGPWVTRTSSPNAAQLAVDIEGTVFAMDAGSGAYLTLMVQIEIEYRLVGAPTWDVYYISPPFTVVIEPHTEYDSEGSPVGVPGYSYVYTPVNIEIKNASTKPVRLTFQRQVAPGQYEVRARKVSANATASSQQNAIQWSALKTYQVDNGDYKGQARLGLQIQATGQLNGSLDDVNWVGTAKPMPYWDGGAWVTATHRGNGLSNPGAIILQLARGIYDEDDRLLAGLGWEDSRIDIESLQLFMVWCAAKNFRFDYFLQETKGIGDLLDDIAAVGLGAISFHTGKLGVIWFADDQPIESVLNMATTKARSFSVDYVTQATADELEFQYFDRNRGHSWKSLRVKAPGVGTPTSTARRPMIGVTEEAHAAVLARFDMAQNVYQRKTVGCEVDLEHLTFRRGTVLGMSHDLTQWGYGGRVQAAVNNAGIVTLHLDDMVPATGPGGVSTRYVGLRLPGENQYRIFPLQAFSGTSRTLTLATAWPDLVPVPGDAPGNPAMDCLWIYDFKATPGQKLRAFSIEPQGNLGGARVALVPESPEFWAYVWTGAYTPPPSNSLLQGPPVVTSVAISEQLGRQGNTYYTELTASFAITGSYERAELWGSIGDGLPQLLASTRSLSMSWRGGLAETWLLELRTFSNQYAGAPYVISYQVKGLATLPPDVLEFKIDGDRLTWTPVVAVDLAGYRIRYNFGQNTWWPTAAALHEGLVTDSPYTMSTRPNGPVTLMIKAVDTSGNESAAAAIIVVNMGDLVSHNVLLDWPQAPAFTGAITGGSVSAGVLQADTTDFFYGPDAEPFYGPDTEPFYLTTTYAEMVYEFYIVVRDRGTLQLLHDVAASTWTIDYLRDSQSAFYGPDTDFFYGPDAEPFYGPTGVWATWPGSIEISSPERIGFRVKTAGGNVRGVVDLLTPQLDVPDVTEKLDDIVIAPGGTRLPITQIYRVIKNLQLTIQTDGNGGVSPRIKDKNPTLGPLVAVVNSSDVEVAGVLDADIEGY